MAQQHLPQLEVLTGRLPRLTLTLEVTDPDVLEELRRQPDEAARAAHALHALRIGVLALRAAAGQLDAATVREEGARLVGELKELLTSRAKDMSAAIGGALEQYLDPRAGHLAQRLDRLLGRDGELDRLLEAKLGGESSTLAQSLAAHLGEQSPVFRLLSPTDANGLKAQLAATIGQALAEQRGVVLREFSLDQKDSALSRLVAEIKGLEGALKEDFSLDREDSALSRLVRRVEASSDQIGRSLTLDDQGSALSRLKRELQATLEELARKNSEFQSDVRTTLKGLEARRQAEERSTAHGAGFEARLGEVLARAAGRLGDVFEATGATTGQISHCKVGDHVIELGRDSAAPGARIVWEAKEVQGYQPRQAVAEIEIARKNRAAQLGVFVFSRKTAPAGLPAFSRQGSDFLVVWDAEDPASDVVLDAAYSAARALAVRQQGSSDERRAAAQEIEASLRAVEKRLNDLEDVKTLATTVCNNGQKIREKAGRIADELREHCALLDRQVLTLRTEDGPAA